VMSNAGWREDAIDLLREGIAQLDRKAGIHILYPIAVRLLAEVGRLDEATELLREGLRNVSQNRREQLEHMFLADFPKTSVAYNIIASVIRSCESDTATNSP
jgi:hypothetical protein